MGKWTETNIYLALTPQYVRQAMSAMLYTLKHVFKVAPINIYFTLQPHVM